MPEYLFAYGTLQPGLAPAAVRAAVDRLTFVGVGSARGRLYDLGEYPGADLDADGTVHGRVYELPADVAVLAAFDRYEGVPDLYVRRAVRVDLSNGGRLTCWAYQYNQPLDDRRRIASGVYPREPRP